MGFVERWRRGWKTRRRASVATAAIVGVVVGVVGTSGTWAATTSGAPTVKVAQGELQGQVKDGLAEYFGIPYAAPPTGPLRWKPPQPAAAWSGVRQATAFGNQCPQLFLGNEDCLYLNVYQPTTPATGPRPVMVWIHGGAYYLGSGSQYDPSIYAKRGAVVVSFNYRIGPFGFLALPSLSAESPDHASGQYGLMDQQAALKWVQQNAAAFGGDPHNVTVFGESAGGGSVCEQIASPTAAGLFQHAIAESGCALPAPSQQEADTTGAAFAAKVGCTDAATAAACLRTRPTSTLINNAGEYSTSTSTAWFPAWGGSLLPKNVLDALTDGTINRVPLINGTNHDEGNLFVESAALLNPVTAQNYNAQLTAHFGAAAVAQIRAHYPLWAYSSPEAALAAADTDAGMACPSYAANQALSARGVSVYAYEFDDPHPWGYPYIQGAGHGSELSYVFQYPVFAGFFGVTNPKAPTTAQLALSNTMIAYWSHMATTGNPNGTTGTPAWPTFSAAQPKYLELTPTGINPNTTMSQRHQCSFWLPLEANGTVNPRL